MAESYVGGRNGGTGDGRASRRSRKRPQGGMELPAPLLNGSAAHHQSPPPMKVQQALLLKDEARDHYDRRNQMIGDMRARRFQERAVGIPKAYRQTTREVRLPLLADQVDLMVAICDDAPWRVHVDPYANGPTAAENSSLRERWSEAALEQAQVELGRTVITNVTDNQIGDGLGVLKVVYRPDNWMDLPTSDKLFGKQAVELDAEQSRKLSRDTDQAKRGARLPFSIVDVDPMTFLPIYGPAGDIEAVIELNERPIRSVLASYVGRLGMEKIGSKWTVVPLAALGEPQPYRGQDRQFDNRATIEVWEYHDRASTTTFVEDVPVSYVEHNTGQVPYFECYAKPNSSRDPERRSRPPSYKQSWLLDLLDSFWTMMSNAGYLYSYPTPVTYTPSDVQVPLGADGRPPSVDFEIGKHITLYQGQELRFVSPPAEHLQLMGDLINQALRMFEQSSGLGPAIRGAGGGDSSGYQVNQLIQASMMSLHPAIRQRDWMMGRAIAYIWRLIEKRLEDSVWVWATNPDPDVQGRVWLALGPKDVRGYYRCKVTTKPLVDQMRISRGQFAASMVKAKLLDRTRAIEEYLGYENPEDIQDAIWVDEALETGPLHDQAVQHALEEAGLIPPKPTGLPGPGGAGPGQPPMLPFGQGAPPLPGLPGLPPTGPGQGLPLVPPTPPPPAPTEAQIAAVGGLAMPGGRAAGADRMPPEQGFRPVAPSSQ